MTQPLILYSHSTGPNPWKVAIILEELGLPYESKFVDMADMHKDPYEKVNPNGRVPSLKNPNDNITLWESGAIIQYLIDKYDKDGKISYGDKVPEKYLQDQWLHFQMSGQGPYFGQKAWFSMFHPEKVPSAVERYSNEIKRVTKVIDRHLSETGQEYLVGNKCTYADLSFVPWDVLVSWMASEISEDVAKEAPKWKAWHDKLVARPAVAKVLADRAKAMGQK